MTSPVLRARLPETELAGLVQAVQAAILKKEVKKTERGINMADEKYVISKASFEDFYETQDTLVSIMEKMVDRIEKQDQVIMKFGAALTEVMSKDFGMPQELAQPVPEDEDVVEEEVPVEDNAEEELEEAEHDIVSAEEEEEEAKEEIQEEEAGVTPVPGVEHAPMMMDEKMAAEKSAFEAGYKAALAEMQKKTGVTVTPLEKPSTMTSRPVVPETSTGGVAKTLDSISDKELADMTPNQLNTWLRENRLYR
jgi:hypothetical protein